MVQTPTATAGKAAGILKRIGDDAAPQQAPLGGVDSAVNALDGPLPLDADFDRGHQPAHQSFRPNAHPMD